MTALSIPIHMFDSEIEQPSYSRTGDGALDVRSTITITLKPGDRALIGCGFSLALPQGYVGLMIPRSGLAIHHGITLLNSPGLIDSNYRGEISVIVINTDPTESFTIHRNDRIGQLLIMPAPTIQWIATDVLSPTERGDHGFGSSGLA